MLKISELESLKKEFLKDKNNIIKRRMLSKVALVDLITDETTELTNDFNILVKTHGVIDQMASGRCWAYSGLNILREKVIEKCNLDSFELSGNYITFYEKIEKFNVILEKLIKLKDSDLYDRDLFNCLEQGFGDGGMFTQFKALVKKYGVVPKNILPDSFSANNSYELNQILSRLIRKFYLDLQTTENIKELKEQYMKDAYLVIASVLGIPPETFDFEYTDKKGKYHIERNLTPKEFYDKFIGIDLDEYIEISSYEDTRYKFNNLIENEDSSRVSGTPNIISLNLPFKDFKRLIIKQLKNKELVNFDCSTTAKRIDGIWIDTLERYGEIFDLDLNMNSNEILKTNAVTGYHAMVLVGAKEIDKKIKMWKIENSWGSKVGSNGYYIATDDWFDKYVTRAIINKKYLTEKQKQILSKKPIVIEKWYMRF